MTLAEAVRIAYPHRFQAGTPPGGCTARIDDHGPADFYWAFCTITVSVHPDETMALTLGFPPLNNEVRAVVDNHRGQVISPPLSKIILDLHPANGAAAAVRDLAAAIKGVTRRGRRYPEKNWKWIVPRTAASLNRFARLLTRHHCRTDGGSERQVRRS